MDYMNVFMYAWIYVCMSNKDAGEKWEYDFCE